MSDLTPLDSDARTRFKILASGITFDGLSVGEKLTGQGILNGLLLSDDALVNGPQFVDKIPGLSAPVKRIFEAAFNAARVAPTTANGATIPPSNTIIMIAAAVGLLIGVGVAILVVD